MLSTLMMFVLAVASQASPSTAPSTDDGIAIGKEYQLRYEVHRTDPVAKWVIALGKMRQAIGGYEAVAAITLEQHQMTDLALRAQRDCTAEERKPILLGKFLWREAKHLPLSEPYTKETSAFLLTPVGEVTKQPFLRFLHWVYAFDGTTLVEISEDTVMTTREAQRAHVVKSSHYKFNPLGLAFPEDDVIFRARGVMTELPLRSPSPGGPAVVKWRWTQSDSKDDTIRLIGEQGEWELPRYRSREDIPRRLPPATFVPSPTHKMEWVLNPRWNLLPTRVTNYRDGVLQNISTVTEAVEVKRGVWFPTKGACEGFFNGRLSAKFTFEVDPESIKIQQNYSASDFQPSIPNPRYHLWDRDTKTAKINPVAIEGQLNKAVDEVKGNPEVKPYLGQ